MANLNMQDKWEEHMFILTSLIRLMSECEFTEEELRGLAKTSKDLARIEEHGGTISNYRLFRLFHANMGAEK